VSSNGLISLGASNSDYTPKQLPVTSSSTPFIAPFWTDIDLRKNNGRIYYRTVSAGRFRTMNSITVLTVISHNQLVRVAQNDPKGTMCAKQ